jgi:DNA-binding MarR family transcriptional regulator
MNESSDLLQRILDLDIRLQRQIYAGWPSSWVQMKLPFGSTRALLLIESGYARTPREVAQVLNVSRTTVTGILDRLETDGLIKRTIDSKDRRSFLIELTDAGRELVQQIDDLRRQQLHNALCKMDAASLKALYQGLEALTHAMDENRLSERPIVEDAEDSNDSQ